MNVGTPSRASANLKTEPRWGSWCTFCLNRGSCSGSDKRSASVVLGCRLEATVVAWINSPLSSSTPSIPVMPAAICLTPAPTRIVPPDASILFCIAWVTAPIPPIGNPVDPLKYCLRGSCPAQILEEASDNGRMSSMYAVPGV